MLFDVPCNTKPRQIAECGCGSKAPPDPQANRRIWRKPGAWQRIVLFAQSLPMRLGFLIPRVLQTQFDAGSNTACRRIAIHVCGSSRLVPW